MIQFSDFTINDTDGHYATICAKMRDEEHQFTWMLRSNATVSVTNLLGQPAFSCSYVLHLWHDGKVVIMLTDHPTNIDIPDNDIRELKSWCDNHGWRTLTVHKLLLEEPLSFDFWKRQYIAGLIDSEELRKHEDDEIKRLSQIAELEEDDDADQSQIHI